MPTPICVLNVGSTPAAAMGMVYQAMSQSTSIAMQNAVANQQRGQVITAAAVTQVLVLINKLGANSK
ncbi:RebB family R body protein [Curvibacter sp. CHRR-16]|uniref:RebB family R body protein n=1 Tax=Curvibacter sp. CHRR-16 TaxID=2835872 RepID=UPI001BD96E49|nr:RebB family R body protein [Curvibacter sp. CHRR-16]MBT0569619.1 RebB family R body protein [Curvibacter sp. CHRR-16]